MPRWLPIVLGAAAAVVLALGLLAMSAAIHSGAPTVDAFYTPPPGVPSQPGSLLRSAPFTRTVPAGAQAWRILYTTTRSDGSRTVASAIVLASTHLPAGPRPIIAWAHGTTGVVPKCAPSLLPDPFTAGALPALDQVVAMGWVLVATDYTGLGTRGPHPYLVGEGEARSVLDAVRAARKMPQPQLADETVVWGHSQGGNAALWTGIIAPSYAPDVKLAGVAALAPAIDLVGLVDNLPHVPGGSIFASYVIVPYSEIYPDIPLEAYVRPAAQAIVRRLATRCLAEPAILASVVTSLAAGKSIFAADPRVGALGGRLRQNSPDSYIAAPLFVAQGEADQLVLPAVQAAWVKRRCAVGQPVEYRTYPGRDHVGVVAPDSPLIGDLLRWTDERFQGVAPPPGCHRFSG